MRFGRVQDRSGYAVRLAAIAPTYQDLVNGPLGISGNA